MEKETVKKLKLEDFPHLLLLKKQIEAIPVGTKEYWEQRCINLEKSLDPTYSKFERDNCNHFWRILAKK